MSIRFVLAAFALLAASPVRAQTAPSSPQTLTPTPLPPASGADTPGAPPTTASSHRPPPARTHRSTGAPRPRRSGPQSSRHPAAPAAILARHAVDAGRRPADPRDGRRCDAPRARQGVRPVARARRRLAAADEGARPRRAGPAEGLSRPEPAPVVGAYCIAAISFSSLIASAANVRMPSASFSVAIASSLNSKRNFDSS